MSFIPENEVNARLFRRCPRACSKEEQDPGWLWWFLRQELVHEPFYSHVFSYRTGKYTAVRLVAPADIQEEVEDHIADAKADYLYWICQPDD